MSEVGIEIYILTHNEIEICKRGWKQELRCEKVCRGCSIVNASEVSILEEWYEELRYFTSKVYKNDSLFKPKHIKCYYASLRYNL